MNTDSKPRVTAQIAGRPLHPLLYPFVFGYFIAACGCDLLYSQANVFVQQSSEEFASITQWLLAAGLIMAGATAIVALVDYLGDKKFRKLPDIGLYAMGSALVVLIELHNLNIRWSEGAAAIAPTGLVLSLAAVTVLLATPSRSWARLYRSARPG
jgi:uncharacterized membrane protein